VILTHAYSKMNQNRPNYHSVMDQSYEFSLLSCGHDKDAGEIWRDHINLIKQWDETTSDKMVAKINKLRGVYQRAVQIPLENVEQLWRDYGAFEDSQGKQSVRLSLSNVI